MAELTSDPLASRVAGALLVGVRLERGGPLLFVDPAGSRLQPGQCVVVARNGVELLATVVVGDGQVLENEAQVAAQGHVLREATAADIRAHGRQRAAQLGLVAGVRLGQVGLRSLGDTEADAWHDSDPGLDIEVRDAWMAADAARLFLVCRGVPSDEPALARRLTHALGMPVTLLGEESDGTLRALSGVEAAGLPSGWKGWLVPLGEAPAVVSAADETGDHATHAGGTVGLAESASGDPEAGAVPSHSPRTEAPSAREFIDRLFPPAERPARRPRGPRNAASSDPGNVQP